MLKDRGIMEEVKLRVITPLFLRGAKAKVEFRPPSLKGVLRFWFRARYPGRLNEEPGIFGSTETGQASFLIRVPDPPVPPERKTELLGSLSYLGYGLDDKGRGPYCYIQPGEEIVVRFIFRPHSKIDGRKEVMESLRCLCLLGGLGARSRRGFGSVVNLADLPADIDELCNQIAGICQRDNLPAEVGHTAFSQRMRVVIPFVAKKWSDALQKIGHELQRFRSNCTEIPKTPRFSRDRDLIYNTIRGIRPTTVPQRVMFGLPHNYFFRNLGSKTASVTGVKRDRRASPLLIHIHLLADGRHAVVVSFLPAPLVPADEKLRITVGKKPNEKVYDGLPVPSDLSAVESFMGHLTRLSGSREVNL